MEVFKNWKAWLVGLLYLLVVGGGICSLWGQELPSNPQPAIKQSFFQSPVNRALVATEFSVRLGDAITTYDMLNGGCRCHERELPSSLAKSPAMFAYSLGVAAGVTFGADFLYHKGHRKLARAVLIADSISDATAVIGNVKLLH